MDYELIRINTKRVFSPENPDGQNDYRISQIGKLLVNRMEIFL